MSVDEPNLLSCWLLPDGAGLGCRFPKQGIATVRKFLASADDSILVFDDICGLCLLMFTCKVSLSGFDVF